jgi:cyanophycinase
MAVLLVPGLVGSSSAAPGFSLFVIGNKPDAAAASQGGSALMGGGRDVDEAFEWMAEGANGGDFVVLRSSGGDDYNEYINDLDPPLDSVATLIVRKRSAASDPQVLAQIAGAEAIFIAGGDQAAYLDLWKDTPLEDKLQERIDAGAVIGGTSAGLVVLSGHVYSARRGTVTSREALLDPFNRQVTLAGSFLSVPFLDDVLADTHFSERNREGRLVAFLARLFGDGPVRGIGVDEETALLVDDAGVATVEGQGRVLLIDPVAVAAPNRLRRGDPLGWRSVPASWASDGDTFDFNVAWTGNGLDDVTLSARRGRLNEQPVP